MSELDDLPSWAGRSTEEVQLPTTPPEPTPIVDDAVPAPPSPPETQPKSAAPPAVDPAPPAATVPPATAPVPEAAPPAQEVTPPVAEPEVAPVQPAIAAKPAIAAQPAIATQPAAATQPTLEAQSALGTQPTMAAQIETDPRRSRLRPILFGLLGLALLAGAAGIGYALATRDSGSTEASGTNAADDLDAPAAPAAGADADSDAADGSDTATDGDTTVGDDDGADDAAAGVDADDPSADEGSDTVTVTVDGDGADPAAGADGDSDANLENGGRQAIFRGGVVYLTGAVPSEEVGAAIVAKAEAVVGPGNVVNEYTIDPAATIEPGSSAPLYVEDVVLFEFNSIAIAPPFLPILDLGTVLLRQNPQASVTVVTRTDAVGSEAVNLEVATRRAQAVIDYWLDQGVDPDQIIADPRGEEGASEDDDAETASLQRRAEFIITGLLD